MRAFHKININCQFVPMPWREAFTVEYSSVREIGGLPEPYTPAKSSLQLASIAFHPVFVRYPIGPRRSCLVLGMDKNQLMINSPHPYIHTYIYTHHRKTLDDVWLINIAFHLKKITKLVGVTTCEHIQHLIHRLLYIGTYIASGPGEKLFYRFQKRLGCSFNPITRDSQVRREKKELIITE